jgi:hypothetical protein
MKNHPYIFTDPPTLWHSGWPFRPLKMRLLSVTKLRGPNTQWSSITSQNSGHLSTVFREIQNLKNVFAGHQNLLTSAKRRERTLRVLCNFIRPRPLPFEEKQHTSTARWSYSIQQANQSSEECFKNVFWSKTIQLSLIKPLTCSLPICYTQHTCSENNCTVFLALNSALSQDDVAKTGGTAPLFLSTALMDKSG